MKAGWKRGCLVLVLLGGVGLSGPVQAQRRTAEAQRELVDDLLRSLIQAELDRRDTQKAPPAGSATPAPQVVNTPTRQMLEARKVLADASRDADVLATRLNEDMRRVAGVRPHMNEVLKLRARTAILAQRSTQINDHNAIADDLRSLDSEWRVLANQLSQLQGLDPRSVQAIERLNGHSRALAGLFEIKPQLNHRELLRHTTALRVVLSNLLEDIELELARSEQRNQLLLSGQRVKQQAGLVNTAVEDQAGHDRVLAEYREFQNLWYPFSARLRPFQNRFLDRHVQRVSQTDSTMHELLWLPHRVDRERLLHLTDNLKKDVDEFFARTPLKLLIDLPETSAVLPTAHEFYGVCAHFADCVTSGDDLADLAEQFQYIEDAKTSFGQVFRPLNSQAALLVLRNIEEHVTALREALQIQDGFQRRRAIELAGSLETLSGHLDADMKRWLTRQRTTFGPQALQESSAFAASCRKLHESITAGGSVSQIQHDTNQLFETWRRLYAHVLRCETQEKVELQSLSARITPALVELQTLLTQ